MSLRRAKMTCDNFKRVTMSPILDNDELMVSPVSNRESPWLTCTDGAGRCDRPRHRRTHSAKPIAAMSRAPWSKSSNDSISTILMYGIIESDEGLSVRIDSNRVT